MGACGVHVSQLASLAGLGPKPSGMRKKIGHIERRADYLRDTLADWPEHMNPKRQSFMEAELDSLEWAIPILVTHMRLEARLRKAGLEDAP